MRLIVKGLEYPCTAAVKTGDEIHIVDTDGNEAVFSGITNMDDYVLEGGEWSETAPTHIDRIEAQVAYTAMMTETLLESEG